MSLLIERILTGTALVVLFIIWASTSIYFGALCWADISTGNYSNALWLGVFAMFCFGMCIANTTIYLKAFIKGN